MTYVHNIDLYVHPAARRLAREMGETWEELDSTRRRWWLELAAFVLRRGAELW